MPYAYWARFFYLWVFSEFLIILFLYLQSAFALIGWLELVFGRNPKLRTKIIEIKSAVITVNKDVIFRKILISLL